MASNWILSVNWDSWGPGLLSAFLSMVTLWLVRRQVRIMNAQTALMQTQNAVALRQDEILDRRARLELKLAPPLYRNDAGYVAYPVRVENQGRKTATSFYWDILLPSQASQDPTVRKDPCTFNSNLVDLDGVTFYRIQGLKGEPTFPTRSVSLGQLRFVPRSSPPIRVLWRLVSEDGMFPADQFGTIELSDLGANASTTVQTMPDPAD